MPIIRSLLDTDLYKFTMWQAMLHRHPTTLAEYRFACRNATAYPLAELEAEVNAELDHLCSLRFSRTSSTTSAACATSRAISLTFCACSSSSATLFGLQPRPKAA